MDLCEKFLPKARGIRTSYSVRKIRVVLHATRIFFPFAKTIVRAPPPLGIFFLQAEHKGTVAAPLSPCATGIVVVPALVKLGLVNV